MKNYLIEFINDVSNVRKESGETYIIKQEQQINCCTDICSTCGICRHIYTCTCVDFNFLKLICKHIHYVVIYNKKNEQAITHTANIENDGHIELFCDVFDKSKETTEEKLNKKIIICFVSYKILITIPWMILH